jgi:(5-formylfuran-3-yl)methyl phosphate synthase
VTRLLASVTGPAEARVALAGGADIIDLKDPARGALGAADPEAVRAVVRAVAGRIPVSATTGDLPLEPEQLRAAVARTAATGVDYVKVGLFGAQIPAVVLDALAGEAARGIRIVAVLFAERAPAPGLLPRLHAAGLAGTMLDTADKAHGSLLELLPAAALAGFVGEARALGLLSGLAGALRAEHIAALLPLGPDYLGFRGALCAAGRTSTLDAAALAAVRDRIPLQQHAG